MTRPLDDVVLAAMIQTGTVDNNVALLAEFDFDSQTIGMWTGLGMISWNGVDFYGGGNLIGVSGYQETEDMQAKGLNFQLSGVSPDLIEIAENEPYQGRKCRLYLAVIERAASGSPLSGVVGVLGAYRIFSGLMDVIDTNEDRSSATITLSAENVLTLLSRTKERRYTSEDQKARYPDDTGLDFISQLQDKSIVW